MLVPAFPSSGPIAAARTHRHRANKLPPPLCRPQAKPTTREWDLNRPDHVKIDSPARIGDEDPRLGVSSLQKFDGEDLSVRGRARHFV